ncbi:DUF1687-domain-containing protein [Hyaloscypha bicolor E]|uniref:DUF1687-domain-containing protein n=1 Tax=Hyaloscypha bicolor E TaxID=1095630 RepID=A0A2J6TCQ5_9HELO|nr:DUF1687-domain-containing protein [Hyaloscypha bicolor E]PMD60810.1 DUF1687-domain-containing protein [Hyaloscypha bicolor E]
MFRFHKTKDVISLFHNAKSPASLRVHTLLKQISANASEPATEDQASDHTPQTNPKRQEFDLEVTEAPPTPDQLKSILEYVGAQKASTIIKGARDEADAMKKLKENSENFQRPITVDWANGRVVAGANESEILKMVQDLPES